MAGPFRPPFQPLSSFSPVSTENWKAVCKDLGRAEPEPWSDLGKVMSQPAEQPRWEAGLNAQQVPPHRWLLLVSSLPSALGTSWAPPWAACPLCRQGLSFPWRALACLPFQPSWLAAFIGHFISEMIALLGNFFKKLFLLYVVCVISWNNITSALTSDAFKPISFKSSVLNRVRRSCY